MERTDILELMSTLKLYGMRAAYDEVMTTGIKRRHETPRIVGDLLSAEIAEKQARSIKYQLTIAKLPLAKDIDDFDFAGTPINETLIRDLVGGGFLVDQHGVALLDEEAAADQVADQGLVDRRAGKVEVIDVLGQRQFGDGQLVFDRARLLLGDLGAEQIANDAGRLVPALDAGGHHLVVS